jgi:dynein assembly factor with WDR repeat domains 1
MQVLLNRILRQEPLIPESKRMYVRKLIYKLIEKQDSQESQQFYLFKILRAHILPLTNCAFNKSGDRFITGSYDRTCKIWNTNTGEELLTLEGHKNVVYAIAFNNPFGDKVITGSFDKTCKVWNANTGELYHTLRGHATEIVCLSFNPQGNVIATGSMDNTAKLWDVETGTGACLKGADSVCKMLPGTTPCPCQLAFAVHAAFAVGACVLKSCARCSTSHSHLWRSQLLSPRRLVSLPPLPSIRSHPDAGLDCLHPCLLCVGGTELCTLLGHTAEIVSLSFNQTGDKLITGSFDHTTKLWDVKSGRCIHTFQVRRERGRET